MRDDSWQQELHDEAQIAAIRAQLARLLEANDLRHSPRLQRLLRHIVEATLAGDGERLKGYTLGVEVYDRGAEFDPNLDPIVRIEAGRLRAKLLAYYSTEGANDAVRIDVPKGGYAARFELRQTACGSKPMRSPQSTRPSRTELDAAEPALVAKTVPAPLRLEVESSITIGGVRIAPDVLVICPASGKRLLAIEVCASHPVGSTKQAAYAREGLPWIEVRALHAIQRFRRTPLCAENWYGSQFPDPPLQLSLMRQGTSDPEQMGRLSPAADQPLPASTNACLAHIG